MQACWRQLQGESGAVTKAGVGKLANLGVTIQRRWANVLSDAARQVVLECFLGLRLKEHFPSQSLAYGNEEGVPLDESEDDLRELEEGGAPAAIENKVLILQVGHVQFPALQISNSAIIILIEIGGSASTITLYFRSKGRSYHWLNHE